MVDAAAPHGLAPPSGSAPGVGAVGYTLGGGVGLLARTVGYASDSVRALDVVTADGELRHVTDGDLFWALRGGRDTVGIVTGMELALRSDATIYGGGLYFDAEFAPGLFERYREWSEGLPGELTTSIGMVPLPPVDALPEPIRGRHVVHVRFAYAGPAAAGEELVAPWHDAGPVLLDTVRTMPYAEGGSIYSDPDLPHSYYGSNAMLSALTEIGLRRVVQLAGPNSPVPLVADLRQLGGALRIGWRRDAVPGRGVRSADDLGRRGRPAPGRDQGQRWRRSSRSCGTRRWAARSASSTGSARRRSTRPRSGRRRCGGGWPGSRPSGTRRTCSGPATR